MGDQLAEALAACKLARADQEALAAAPGASNDARRDLAETVNELGLVLRETGRLSEAEAEHRTALAIQQKLADDHPTVTLLAAIGGISRMSTSPSRWRRECQADESSAAGRSAVAGATDGT